MNAEKDESWAFQAYEAVRDRLPAPKFLGGYKNAATLADIADGFDVFLLDAFGVLNIGETAIDGVAERIRDLRAAGKRVIIVTNAAGYPKRILMERYERLGYEFSDDDIVSSREALLRELENRPAIHWGIMVSRRFGLEELDHLDCQFLTEDQASYSDVDGFLMIGSADWTEKRQELLVDAVKSNPRPVLVGNPDIVAPRDIGFSLEPGHYAHRLADQTGIRPEFLGKPFHNIYDLAFARICADTPRDRILMVGDTLHTDILGGRVAGISTALVSGFGSLADSDAELAIRQSGIVPDFVIDRP